MSSINLRVLLCDFTPLPQCWASLVAQLVKSPLAIQETLVRFLGWEDALEKEMATHSSVLAWEIPLLEEPRELQSMGSQRAGHDSTTKQQQRSRWPPPPVPHAASQIQITQIVTI